MSNKSTQQLPNELETLIKLKNVIFGLDASNITRTTNFIMNKFCQNYPISLNTILCQLIYISSMIKKNNFDVYLNLLKEIQQYEENNKSSSKISDVFSQYLNDEKTINESFYFLNCMIDYNLLEVKTIQDMKNPYFIHLNPKITKNLYGCWFKHEIKMQNIEYEDLKKNDWELHKQYIKEGHNPNEIAKIIRNDEIEKLQEISSQSNFDYNQTIKPSLYERYSFIDKENVTLIDYAAFFSAEKCFKYLLMNGSNAINTGKYAIAGGNLEIIHLCEQNHSSFEDAYETAIQYHRNDIFKYIYENKILEINRLDEFGVKCISCHNYEIFLFLLKEGMKVNNNIINEAATHGNLFLVKYFLKENQLPKSILSFSAKSGNIELVKYILEQKEIDIKHKGKALIMASEYNKIEIVKLLLEQKGIDINIQTRYDRDSALFRASNGGHTEIVKLLLEQKGIDINVKPLIGASLNGESKIVKLLLEQKGIDINAKDNDGWTALICASLNGHTEIVKLLLGQKGIDINAKDNNGETGLMYASMMGHLEIVKLLLEQKGIDVNAIDNDGETAFAKATKKGHEEIATLIASKK